MEEVKSENLEVKRPWQGNVLIFLEVFFISIIFSSLFLAFIFTDFFIFLNDFFIKFYNFRWDAVVLMTYYPIFSIGAVFSYNDNFIVFMSIPFFIVDIFIIFGFLKGWKITIIFSLIYSLLVIVYLSFSFFIEIGTLRAFLLLILLHIFTFYLKFFCLNHPFYNQKINKT